MMKVTCFSSPFPPENVGFNCLSMASIAIMCSVNIWIINVFLMAALQRITVTEIIMRCEYVNNADIILGLTNRISFTYILQ